jgi:hypothetical protein
VLSVLENFGYRQYLALARFRGVLMAMLGRRGWGAMEKKGVLAEHDAAGAVVRPPAVVPRVAQPARDLVPAGGAPAWAAGLDNADAAGSSRVGGVS